MQPRMLGGETRLRLHSFDLFRGLIFSQAPSPSGRGFYIPAPTRDN